MPSQVLTSVENNFTKGLITESTGLNFPENAATDTDNCTYTLIGDVLRREGIDLEVNFGTAVINRAGGAVTSYKWNNAGGDGNTQLLAVQIGGSVYFYSITAANTSTPLSTQKLASTIDLSTFAAQGATFLISNECTFADGNGYLFIYHPNCDPIYCIYAASTITGSRIVIQTRDLVGIPEPGVPDNQRPSTLGGPHLYNVQNQGWTAGNAWATTSTTSVTVGTGAKVFNVATGLTITAGQTVLVTGTVSTGGFGPPPPVSMTGTVTSYSSSTLTLSITGITGSGTTASWNITQLSAGFTSAWFTAVGNFPSNADQWWRFKNTSGVFDPTTTQANTSIGLGAAPKGHYILNAFQQYRGAAIGSTGIADVVTPQRPTNGAWFQGRVWYTGVTASIPAQFQMPSFTWTETIYFSQVVDDATDFAKCYQQNDPTSQLLFDILPTDGGTIIIQGAGTIFKLFPTQNGMLVFAANGVWFITGSRGIGFTANDYTITKISNVESLSTNSFVDVLGLPFFWNEEGIYQVTSANNNGLTVASITVGTIQTFYDAIPKQSKKYVKAAYNPIEYVIQWIYKDSNETSITDRYSFNRILNYNTYNKAFYPYSIQEAGQGYFINSINYIQGPGGSTSPDPAFKYVASILASGLLSFADEHDTAYGDWFNASGKVTRVNYNSFFVTGYKLHGQAQRRFQMPYIYMYNRMTGNSLGYNIQGIWDYAADRNSNRWSVPQTVLIAKSRFVNVFKRHRIRGQGLVLQIKVYSVDGQPFDVMGWSVLENQNTGV